MAIRQNVAQQNQASKDAIAHMALAFIQQRQNFEWLVRILKQHGLSPETGSLVRWVDIPEQEGRFLTGVWLASPNQFWAFEAIVSYANDELVALERFEDVTATIAVNAHTPGVGASWGYLALQVHHELRGG